jgi:putative transposase
MPCPQPDEELEEQYRRSLKRWEVPGHHRFLTFSCFDRRPYFVSDRTKDWAVELLARAQEKHRFRLRTFVIIPEHVHLLIQPTSGTVEQILYTFKKSLSNRVLTWCERNAPEFLVRMRDVSPSGKYSHRFWQRGAGYDRNVWSKEYFWEVVKYTHRNPVERGLCARPLDWKWSSAGAWAGQSPIVPIDRSGIPDPVDRWYS